MSFLVIGEALVDKVRRGDTTTTHPGGSPLNVAVGLARLDRQTTLITRIGDDDEGEMIAEYLADNGVRLYPGSIDDHPTSVARVELDDQGDASYTFEVRSSFPDVETVKAQVAAMATDGEIPHAVHIGSVGAHLEPGASQLREWLKALAGKATIFYDPNVRLSLVGPAEKMLADIDEMMEYIDVFKCSEDDLYELFEDANADRGAKYFLARGAKLVVITQGKRGLSLYTPHVKVSVPARQLPVVDTVGAGDSLTSALIDGMSRLTLLGGEDAESIPHMSAGSLVSLGSYAAAAAAITVTRAGANPPTRQEISQATELYAVTPTL
ncbi:MAG: carbohydrate kinase [Actinomycetaceae bacterium]|nr:carbohydrate kinase [Actinomycetaceae bacterium]